MSGDLGETVGGLVSAGGKAASIDAAYKSYNLQVDANAQEKLDRATAGGLAEQQAAAARAAQDEQHQMTLAQNAQNRRKQMKAARIATADIEAQSFSRGMSGSAKAATKGDVRSQYTSQMAFGNRMQASADLASKFNQEAADYGTSMSMLGQSAADMRSRANLAAQRSSIFAQQADNAGTIATGTIDVISKGVDLIAGGYKAWKEWND